MKERIRYCKVLYKDAVEAARKANLLSRIGKKEVLDVIKFKIEGLKSIFNVYQLIEFCGTLATIDRLNGIVYNKNVQLKKLLQKAEEVSLSTYCKRKDLTRPQRVALVLASACLYQLALKEEIVAHGYYIIKRGAPEDVYEFHESRRRRK